MQRELDERRLSAPGGGHLQVRAGIVLADVLVAGDDLYGSGVNLAVRVQAMSPPGGMAITKWMYQYLDGRIGSAVHRSRADRAQERLAHGAHSMSGIPTRLIARARAARCRAPAASVRPSVVVLPFDNLSGEADQAYFADAVVEEITATLSRIRDFFVIARNSAFAYKGRSIDVRQVGRELGVRYVVEGSVRRVGERVRITAQLVETETANHIWSTRIDGAVSELFDLQDRVAAEVASALQPSIRRVEVERARSKRPETLAAYDLVMRALPHLWAHRMAENPQAISYLTRALALEPQYGLAAALAPGRMASRSPITGPRTLLASAPKGSG